MRTAIDTNVLSALISADRNAVFLSEELFHSLEMGSVSICAPVYSELLAHPRSSIAEIDYFLESSGIVIDYLLHPHIWLTAGAAFREYAQRRRRSQGVEPKRLLIDFVVGAHASLRADRLFTLDPQSLRSRVPKTALKLNLHDPRSRAASTRPLP